VGESSDIAGDLERGSGAVVQKAYQPATLVAGRRGRLAGCFRAAGEKKAIHMQTVAAARVVGLSGTHRRWLIAE